MFPFFCIQWEVALRPQGPTSLIVLLPYLGLIQRIQGYDCTGPLPAHSDESAVVVAGLESAIIVSPRSFSPHVYSETLN